MALNIATRPPGPVPGTAQMGDTWLVAEQLHTVRPGPKELLLPLQLLPWKHVCSGARFLSQGAESNQLTPDNVVGS